MSMRSRAAWRLLYAIVLTGCSLPTSKSGQACQRSTQCEAGLACVSGKCSKDLSSIAAKNSVPMLGAGVPAAAGGGGVGGSAADGGRGGSPVESGGAGG
jgi:hypothetical protein